MVTRGPAHEPIARTAAAHAGNRPRRAQRAWLVVCADAPPKHVAVAHTPRALKIDSDAGGGWPWRTAAQPSEATHLDTLSQANVMLSVGNNGHRTRMETDASSRRWHPRSRPRPRQACSRRAASRPCDRVTCRQPGHRQQRRTDARRFQRAASESVAMRGGERQPAARAGGARGERRRLLSSSRRTANVCSTVALSALYRRRQRRALRRPGVAGAHTKSCRVPRPVGASQGGLGEAVLSEAGEEQVLVPLVRPSEARGAWALANLTSNPDNKMKILQLGALDRLRALHLSPSDEVQAASTKVLASLGEILTPSSRRAISSRKSHGTTPAAVGSSARRSSPLVAQGPDEEGMGASSRLASDLGSFKKLSFIRCKTYTCHRCFMDTTAWEWRVRGVDSGRGRRSERVRRRREVGWSPVGRGRHVGRAMGGTTLR